jgi:hypothetical protein
MKAITSLFGFFVVSAFAGHAIDQGKYGFGAIFCLLAMLLATLTVVEYMRPKP